VRYRVYGWRHLVKATEVTAGLAESILAAYRRVDGLQSPVRADCLYTGISAPRPRAQHSVTSMGEVFTVVNLRPVFRSLPEPTG